MLTLRSIGKVGGHSVSGLLLLTVLAVTMAACGRSTGPGQARPERAGAETRPLEVYKQLGMLAGSEDYPGVASFVTMAGPSDSTYVLFGLSLPNHALRFQPADTGFVGEYEVQLSFLRDGEEVTRLERQERVRVPTFDETSRTGESVIFQSIISLEPGQYEVKVRTSDVNSSRGFETVDTLDVPAYGARGPGIPAAAWFVYEAEGRNSAGVTPEMILNPRQTVPFGGDVPRLYVEAYNVAENHPIGIRVVDDQGEEVWRTQARLGAGSEDVRHTVVEIPSRELPMGRLWVEVAANGSDQTTLRRPLLITISDQWVVANVDELLRFVEHIAHPQELDSLRTSSGAERNQLWERFWERRDPLPATSINEFREEFFSRVRLATEQLAEPGVPGWRTDRGRVYIVLGPPTHVIPREVRGAASTPGRPNATEWIYERAPGGGRLELAFIDRQGFGRFEMTRASEVAFRAAASRLRPRA
jgi:GWxTD domain-containing protein